MHDDFHYKAYRRRLKAGSRDFEYWYDRRIDDRMELYWFVDSWIKLHSEKTNDRNETYYIQYRFMIRFDFYWSRHTWSLIFLIPVKEALSSMRQNRPVSVTTVMDLYNNATVFAVYLLSYIKGEVDTTYCNTFINDQGDAWKKQWDQDESPKDPKIWIFFWEETNMIRSYIYIYIYIYIRSGLWAI